MNTYLVNLTIFTGGYEKTGIHLVESDNPINAGRTAIEDESHDPDELEFDGDTEASDMGGEFVYRVYSVKEATPEDAVILRKYI